MPSRRVKIDRDPNHRRPARITHGRGFLLENALYFVVENVIIKVLNEKMNMSYHKTIRALLGLCLDVLEKDETWPELDLAPEETIDYVLTELMEGRGESFDPDELDAVVDDPVADDRMINFKLKGRTVNCSKHTARVLRALVVMDDNSPEDLLSSIEELHDSGAFS